MFQYAFIVKGSFMTIPTFVAVLVKCYSRVSL